MLNPSYLDFGSALAAYGLIFAVYQLRTRQGDIILRIRSSWQRNLIWILAILGLLATLMAVLETDPAGSLAYQIEGYFLFIASPLSLLILSVRSKGLFNKQTARKFYEVMVWEISTADETRINATIEVILNNFKNICQSLTDSREDVKVKESARAILDVIFSDELVVKILTTKRLDALQTIVNLINEYDITERQSRVGVPKIIHNLFYDKESFFYKQLSEQGLALSLNLYDNIFGSSRFLSNFNVFASPSTEYGMGRVVGLAGIKVFNEGLLRTIRTYFSDHNVPARHINDGFLRQSEMFEDICLKLSLEAQRGIDTKYTCKEDWLALQEITRFLGRSCFDVYDKSSEFQNRIRLEPSAKKADFFSDNTINAGVAAALYKAFQALSYIKDTKEIYHMTHELLYSFSYSEEQGSGYRGAFEEVLWRKISENVVRRWYPAVLRAYLEAIGYYLGSGNTNQGWIGKEAERVRRLLYVDLKPLFEKDVCMVDKIPMREALLPTCMNFRDGKFFYAYGFGKEEGKEIAASEVGAASALVGVDLESPIIL